MIFFQIKANATIESEIIYVKIETENVMLQFHILVESTKTASMEDVSTGVLEKKKNI